MKKEFWVVQKERAIKVAVSCCDIKTKLNFRPKPMTMLMKKYSKENLTYEAAGHNTVIRHAILSNGIQTLIADIDGDMLRNLRPFNYSIARRLPADEKVRIITDNMSQVQISDILLALSKRESMQRKARNEGRQRRR